MSFLRRAGHVDVKDNKFHAGNERDGQHYWLTPPALYARLDAQYAFDFDPCPFPKPDDFDGLTAEWGASSYVNPPFGSIDHEGKKKGMTAWVRKAIAEHQKGKRVVMVFPVDKWLLMLVAAGAKISNLGDVKWLSTEDGTPGRGTGRHIACFVLDNHKDDRVNWLMTKPTFKERDMKFIIETDDPVLAGKLLDLANSAPFSAPNGANEAPPNVPYNGPYGFDPATGKPRTVPENTTPVSILPGTADVAPNAAQAVPVPAVTPVPATPAPSATPPTATTAPVSAEDKAALDQGWTFDHVKAAATAFVSKLGNEGPAALQAILTEFGAKGAKDLSPAQFPLIHARLTAATAA